MIPCTLGGSIKATQAFKKESQRTTRFHKSSSAPRAANSFKLFVTSVACRSRTSLNQWPNCLHPIIPYYPFLCRFALGTAQAGFQGFFKGGRGASDFSSVVARDRRRASSVVDTAF